MSIFDRIVEEKIRAAQQSGEFDNLAGKGKPLQLDENVFANSEERLAQHLLRNNGFAPPWIEAGREIEAERLRLHASLRLAQSSARAEPSAEVQAAFIKRIEELNRQILRYNLQVPAPVFQRPLLDARAEIQAALAES